MMKHFDYFIKEKKKTHCYLRKKITLIFQLSFVLNMKILQYFLHKYYHLQWLRAERVIFNFSE